MIAQVWRVFYQQEQEVSLNSDLNTVSIIVTPERPLESPRFRSEKDDRHVMAQIVCCSSTASDS